VPEQHDQRRDRPIPDDVRHAAIVWLAGRMMWAQASRCKTRAVLHFTAMLVLTLNAAAHWRHDLTGLYTYTSTKSWPSRFYRHAFLSDRAVDAGRSHRVRNLTVAATFRCLSTGNGQKREAAQKPRSHGERTESRFRKESSSINQQFAAVDQTGHPHAVRRAGVLVWRPDQRALLS